MTEGTATPISTPVNDNQQIDITRIRAFFALPGDTPAMELWEEHQALKPMISELCDIIEGDILDEIEAARIELAASLGEDASLVDQRPVDSLEVGEV